MTLSFMNSATVRSSPYTDDKTGTQGEQRGTSSEKKKDKAVSDSSEIIIFLCPRILLYISFTTWSGLHVGEKISLTHSLIGYQIKVINHI